MESDLKHLLLVFVLITFQTHLKLLYNITHTDTLSDLTERLFLLLFDFSIARHCGDDIDS